MNAWHWSPECNLSNVSPALLPTLSILQDSEAVSAQPPSFTVIPLGNQFYTCEINFPRQTLAGPGKQAAVHLALKLLRSLILSLWKRRGTVCRVRQYVWLGPGLQQGQARASQPGVQELPVTWRPTLARKEVFWPVCLLWGSLAAPSSAKTSRCKENAWKTLVTQSTPGGCAWGNPSWGGGVGGTF